MAEKRRLPIVQNNPPAGGPAHDHGEGHGGDENETPPWHWVPLGTVISLAVGVVLARSLYLPFQQRAVERVYGHISSPEEFARVDAGVTQAARDALQLKLSLAGMSIALIAVIVGGFIVGRFGARTNARHGTLAGLTTALLLVMFVGSRITGQAVLAYLLFVPLSGLVGYTGARLGLALRAAG